ncbi:MAG: tetratricopeptide repeat protein [Hyphomicrobiales bacterium]|nr:tetratricopeptide repeat protein [Hyphomicrobiales bacterium]
MPGMRPPALAGRFAVEPKWVDLRAYRDQLDPRDSRFVEAGADFAAAIHGQPKEDLLSQELRQQRRALRQAVSAAGLLVALSGLAGWQWQEAEASRRIALGAEQVAIEQREVARKQRDTADWQRGLAEQQRKRAEQERVRAEKNYAAARSTVESLVRDVARGLRNVEGLRGETIALVLDTVKRTADQLAKTNPDDLLLEASRADMYGQFAATYMTAGDYKRSLQASADMLAIARALSAQEPATAAHRSRIAAAQVMIGYMHFLAGNDALAETPYREATDILRALVTQEPAHDRWRIDLAFGLDKIGELRGRQGDRDGAFAANAEALDMRRALLLRNPANTDYQFWVAVSLDRIGKLKQQVEEFDAAAEAFAESLGIMRKLSARDSASTQLQRDLALSLRSNGAVSHARGRLDEALTAYEESLTIERRLARLDPGNATWQQGLGIALDRLGTVREALSDVAGARRAYGEARDVFRSGHGKIRSDISLRNLVIVLSKIGQLAEKHGDPAGAARAYGEWLDLLDGRSAANTTSGEIDRVYPLLGLARVGDQDRARERLVQARDILNRAGSARELTATQRRWFAEIERALAQRAEADARAGQPALQ